MVRLSKQTGSVFSVWSDWIGARLEVGGSISGVLA